MTSSPRGLLIKGKFLELKSLLESDNSIPLIEKAELASHLLFQVGQLKDPVKPTFLVSILEPLLLNFYLSKIIQILQFVFFQTLSLVSKSLITKLELLYLSNVIHYRYTDFKTGLIYSSHLIAIAMVNKNPIKIYYFQGLFGHFLSLNGKTENGLKLLHGAEIKLRETQSNTSDKEQETLHQYLNEISAILTFHLSFLGFYTSSHMRYKNILNRLYLYPYYWVELFSRSMRMNESLDRLDGSMLYKDITQMKHLLGKKNSTKYLLRTKIFSALMSATQGDMNLAKELLLDLTLDYSSATSKIELGRFYLSLALLSIEIGEIEKAKNSILKAKMFFAEIPNSILHSLDAELIGFEVSLRLIPLSNLNRHSKIEARAIRLGVEAIQNKCKKIPYFKLRCEVLIAASYFLEENVKKAQSIIKNISDHDKQMFRRFFLSMSSIAPLGCERSAKELGFRNDVIINKNVITLFSEFLLGSDTIDSIGKLVGTLLASREKVEVRFIEKSNIGNKDPFYTFEEVSSDIYRVQFHLKQKMVECNVHLPLSKPEWDTAIMMQLNMITTILQHIENKNTIIENEKILTFNSVAKQVAHDIRSPLAALNSLLIDTKEVPESKRIILRTATNRINDIANNLLSSQKSNKNISTSTSFKKSVELISACLDSLLSEKRIQFRSKSGISLEGDLNSGYGLFAEIETSEFQRVISNLINNSVESIDSEFGHVKIMVDQLQNYVRISIIDNGKGIPGHILERLGTQEITFGKEKNNLEGGNGIGVYHAKQTIESFGGKFHIQSIIDKGTYITITLPIAPTPKWFINSINVEMNAVIICVDDDQTIHQIWQNRFPHHQIHHFTSPKIFEIWWKNNGRQISNKIVLIDYEFLSHQANGFNIIEDLGINKDSNTSSVMLVSSHYEEKELQVKAEEIGVQIIPKCMAAIIPIHFNTKCNQIDFSNDKHLISRSNLTHLNAMTHAIDKIKYDLCLIDDDTQLVHPVWRSIAMEKKLNIKLFSTPSDFIANSNNIDKSTPIYIDVSLGGGIQGTDFAHALHKLGFMEINLATGYDADSIEVPSFICKVVGKDFPLQ